jgi:hypothetical protein
MKGAFKSIIELFCMLASIIYVLSGVLLVINAFLVLFDIVGGVEYLPLPKGLWVLMIFGAAAALFLTLFAFAIGLAGNVVLPKIPATILTLVLPIFIMFTANTITKCSGGVQPPPGCIESWFSWLSLIYMFYIPESFSISLMIRQYILTKITLPRIEYEIEMLKRRIDEYGDVLRLKEEIECSISNIVRHDPANFGFKKKEFKEKAGGMTDDGIRKEKAEIEIRLSQSLNLREGVEGRLRTLEEEKRVLEAKVEEIDGILNVMERTDPANFQVKLEKLKQLERIGLEELKKIKPVGEIEKLFFERTSLKFQIEDIDKKIEETAKELSHIKLKEFSLQLENLILDLEIVERKVMAEEPRILEIKNRLTRLQSERNRIIGSHEKQYT